MSLAAREAAIQIAKRVKDPIKVTERVERVLKTKGVELKGKTPKATIGAQIYTECARDTQDPRCPTSACASSS